MGRGAGWRFENRNRTISLFISLHSDREFEKFYKLNFI